MRPRLWAAGSRERWFEFRVWPYKEGKWMKFRDLIQALRRGMVIASQTGHTVKLRWRVSHGENTYIQKAKMYPPRHEAEAGDMEYPDSWGDLPRDV